MSKPKRKGTATTTAAPKQESTKTPAKTAAKGPKGGAATPPAAPPLGHHIKPTGDRRKRFRKD